MADGTKGKALWSCGRWPGGSHWHVTISMLAAGSDGPYENVIEHPKFESPERALMWIETEFGKLGDRYELLEARAFHYEDCPQIEGVEAMRAEIRRRGGVGKWERY